MLPTSWLRSKKTRGGQQEEEEEKNRKRVSGRINKGNSTSACQLTTTTTSASRQSGNLHAQLSIEELSENHRLQGGCGRDNGTRAADGPAAPSTRPAHRRGRGCRMVDFLSRVFSSSNSNLNNLTQVDGGAAAATTTINSSDKPNTNRRLKSPLRKLKLRASSSSKSSPPTTSNDQHLHSNRNLGNNSNNNNNSNNRSKTKLKAQIEDQQNDEQHQQQQQQNEQVRRGPEVAETGRPVEKTTNQMAQVSANMRLVVTRGQCVVVVVVLLLVCFAITCSGSIMFSVFFFPTFPSLHYPLPDH